MTMTMTTATPTDTRSERVLVQGVGEGGLLTDEARKIFCGF